MGTFGVQNGPGVLVDGKDPSIAATVTPPTKSPDGQTSAVQTLQEVLDAQTGFIRPQGGDAAGRVVLSDTDKLTLILSELRIQTYYLSCLAAGIVATDDPDALRLDADQSGLLTALS